MNEQILIVLAEEERGGLFDFGATLPLVAVQFLVLMVVLNLILYTPLLTLINKRNEYIVSNLAKASEMLAEVTDQTIQIYGGMGLMDDLPLERFWRDARVERIYDGTSEIQRHIISRDLLRPLGA